MKICKVDGCETLAYRRLSVCATHYGRWRKFKSYDPVPRGGFKRVEVPSYRALHSRLAADRGKASQYQCGCGAPAKQWAYTHSGVQEHPSNQGPYSTDLHQYVPMCMSCHRKFDGNREKIPA